MKTTMTNSVVRFVGLSIVCSVCTLLFPFDRIGVASGLSYAHIGSSAGRTRTRNLVSVSVSDIIHRNRSASGGFSVLAAESPNTADVGVNPMSHTQTGLCDELPWRDTNSSPLSGKELQSLVVQASLLEEFDDDDDENGSFLDVPGVAWLEHINLIVGKTSEDRSVAEAFYLDILGMTPDKGKSFHVNLGRQQFHLATPKRDDEVAHRIHGSVGLAVPDLEALCERLELARKDQESTNNYGLRGTLFDFYEEQWEDSKIIAVRCPWGNVFRCYSATDRGAGSVSSSLLSEIEESPQKMTTLHSPELGLHGSDKMGVLSVGQPGIRFVELICPVGVSAHQICAFYKTMLNCPARVLPTSDEATNCCVVSVGAGVQLVFVEGGASQTTSTGTSDDDDDDNANDNNAQHLMRGVHICIYAHNFRELYNRLSSKSLIWTNPRFVYLDSCDTWEEARKSRTLRFRHIVDVSTDNPKVLMELEHETRPLRHGQFMKVPYYVPK